MPARLAFETMAQLGQAERYQLRDALTVYGSVNGEWYLKPSNIGPHDGVPVPTFNDTHRDAMNKLRAETKGYVDTDVVCGISIETERRIQAKASSSGTELRNVIEYVLTADVFSLRS